MVCRGGKDDDARGVRLIRVPTANHMAPDITAANRQNFDIHTPSSSINDHDPPPTRVHDARPR